MSDFVHLHCHTDYSYLESLLSVEGLCKGASELGMDSIAITDRGTLAGVPSFLAASRLYGIKPIVGCEVCVVGTSCQPDLTQPAFHRLVLLASNSTGYRNLKEILMASEKVSPVDGIVTTKTILAKHHEGLLALSGAEKGEVHRALKAHGTQAALIVSEGYTRIFEGQFYLEIQPQVDSETEAQDSIIDFAEAAQLPLVVTNNVHYLNSTQSKAHDFLLCVREDATIDTKSRTRYQADRSLCSPQAMCGLFADRQEALDNTIKIANQCEHYDIGEQEYQLGRESRFREKSAFIAAARAWGLPSGAAQGLLKGASEGKLDSIFHGRRDYELLSSIAADFIGIRNCRPSRKR